MIQGLKTKQKGIYTMIRYTIIPRTKFWKCN